MRLKSMFIVMTGMLVFFGQACKEKSKELTGNFTFIKGDVTVNSKKVTIGTPVRSKDVVNVSDASGAIIQFSTGALITLKANTELEVSKLLYGSDGKPGIELNQQKGSTFSKIQPGKAEYKISTPTAVAGVRGTAFNISVGGAGKTEIQLLQGKVAVSKPSAKAEGSSEAAAPKEEPVELQAGQKLETSSEGIEEAVKLKADEKENLEKLNQITFVAEDKLVDEKALKEEATTIAPESVVQETIVEDSTSIAAATDEKETVKKAEKAKKEEAPKMTLAELKKKYGQLSKITTKDGQSYVGAFEQQGSNMVITTIDGKVKVPVANIAKVSPHN